jgi:hypothetical protein
MRSKHSLQASDYENLNFDSWAEDSYQIAATYAYDGITEGVKLEDDYVTANNDRTERQIVLGGYRLAHVIKTIFGSKAATFLQ